MKAIKDRQRVVDALHSAKHAMMHLKQAGTPEGELQYGINALDSAINALTEATRDVVYASTGAEWCSDGSKVTVGVTAQCRCGHTFVDDVRCCGPK